MENKENKSELIIYQTEDGKIKIDVRFQNETVWLTQQLLSLKNKIKPLINTD